MGNARIDIGIPRPAARTPQSIALSTSWPVKPFEGRHPSPRSLEIRFFNLATQRKSSGSPEFILSPLFNMTSWEETYTLEPPPEGSAYDTKLEHWQSKRIPTVNEYRDEFKTSNDKRFDRESLRRITDDELEANGGVYPVGVRSPAIRCYLKTPDGGSVDMVDYLAIKRGQCRGQLNQIEDDDGNNALCYRWGEAPLSQMHLKIEEIISGVSWDRCVAHGRREETQSDGITFYGDDLQTFGEFWQDGIDGLLYPAWDTSDTDNIKITKVPYYDCADDDEVTDTPIKLTGSQNRISVYLVPRKVFAVADYRWRENDGNLYHKRYGIFMMPPHDFAMPPPRVAGMTELSRTFYSGAGMEENPALAHVFQDWEGDSEEANRFHVFNHIPWSWLYAGDMNSFWKCGHYDNLGCQGGEGDPYYQYMPGNGMTWDWTPYVLMVSFTDAGGAGFTEVDPRYKFYGRISSMPDGKVPHANARVDVPDSYPWTGSGTLWREGYVYGVDRHDAVFWTPEKCAPMQSLKDAVFSHTLLASPPAAPFQMDAWTACAAGWGERELIAVIVNENSGEELYVWAKDGQVERLNDRMWSSNPERRDFLADNRIIQICRDRVWSWCGTGGLVQWGHVIDIDGFMSPNWGQDTEKAQWNQLAFRRWAGGGLIYRIPAPDGVGTVLTNENHSTADLPIGDEYSYLSPPFEEDGLYLGCFVVPFIVENSYRDHTEGYMN